MTYLIADSRSWRPNMAQNLERRLGGRFHSIRNAAELTPEKITALGVQRAFFPYWSDRIPESIYSSIDCVVFHMTDLPFGRGGSPLQNLIVRGFKETRISAIKCTAGLDGGPVYLKRPLSLEGSAHEIFTRASEIIEDMIVEIVTSSPKPTEQQGEATVFRRRTPEESNIAGLSDLGRIYDYIRMLDADGYPHAFIDVGGFRYEFRGASLEDGSVLANVAIRRKP